MALSFGISPTQNCGNLTFKNCSTYCTPTNYDVAYCIASIDSNTYQIFGDNGNILLASNSYSTSGISDPGTQVLWSFGAFTTYGNIVAIPGLQVGSNLISLTVTDDDGLVSSTRIYVYLSDLVSQPDWVASASLNITTANPNPDLIVRFDDNSTLINTTIDDTTVILDPDSPLGPTYDVMPQNYDYGAIGGYDLEYSYNETENGDALVFTTEVVITASETDCTSEMTESGLDSIVLYITDPDNNDYTYDITDSFFDAPFTLESEDVTETETWASGIWTFRLVVTKDNGVQLVSEIKVTLICAEECAFNTLLINYANEEADCCEECKNAKEENIILLRTYINAIKNANACGSTTQITKFLSLVQRKLSQNNCGC